MLRTTKETGVNLLDVFQPLEISNQDLNDPHRFEQKCLGSACIHIGDKTIPHCTFFEIIESTEISETSSPEQEELLICSDESSSLDELASFALTKSLPPKKRKRRRMIRCDLAFSVESQLDTFYRFPREALVECLTTSVPHKLVLSFLPLNLKNQQCACVLEEGYFKTKLEEFAAVCSHSCKLTDQSKSDKHIQSILISNVSFELLQAIKQESTMYEIMCQNMMELMRLHHEKVTHHKSENAAQSKVVNYLDEQVKEGDEDEDMDDLEEVAIKPAAKNQTSTVGSTKKCLYCGSKSTPMWRRGPQGAGTLCNACGVKWKHGKILNGADSAPQTTTARRGSKPEKKRKRSTSNSKKNSKRKSVSNDDEFAVPAPPMQQPTWDTTSSSSMSESPLETSPNTSPLHKEGIIAYNAEALSLYAGEEAVEAAALLTLLKRS